MVWKVHFEVHKEYVTKLMDQLKKWSAKKDSMIFPQFLDEMGLGYSYFYHIMQQSPALHNVYEATLAKLCERWYQSGCRQKDMPAHMQKTYLKYLNVYDQHARHVTLEDKKEIAAVESQISAEIGRAHV